MLISVKDGGLVLHNLRLHKDNKLINKMPPYLGLECGLKGEYRFSPKVFDRTTSMFA
jgi:hypothetical protein